MESARVASVELLHELEAVHRAVVVPELAIAAGAGLELWDVECRATVDVPAEIPRGRHVALQVSGDSMEPLIHSGDLVLVRLDGKAVPSTVVVARDPDHGYVVKEVGRLTANGIELRSLNPAYPVLRVPHGTRSVLGTVVLRWPAPSSSRDRAAALRAR
jgi:phage repressor protein C with HTH and peptisase S24 domain